MGKCAIPKCKRKSVYFMGFPTSGEKYFGYVCESHDKRIGRRNLMVFADMTREQAIKFEEGK